MKQLTFNLPDDLAQKFELAIELTGANRDAVAEEFVRGYLANALQSAANQYKTPDPVQPSPAPAQTPFRQAVPPVAAAPPAAADSGGLREYFSLNPVTMFSGVLPALR